MNMPAVSLSYKRLSSPASLIRGQAMPTDPQRAIDALHHLTPPASRAEWIKLGIAAKRAGVPFEEFHNWSRSGEGYENERQCQADWNAMTEAGDITPASLFRAARDSGWRDNVPLHQLAPIAKKPILLTEQQKDAPKPNAKAAEIWERCEPSVNTHPYIEKKGGQPDGLRIYPATAPPLTIQGNDVAGYLVIPCYSGGQIQTIQFVPAEGAKLNLPGCSFGDGYFATGSVEAGTTVYIAEGIGQVWACHRATQSPAVCSFGAGRMGAVAQAIARDHPDVKIVLVPDRGQEEVATKITNSLLCRWVPMPENSDANYDANDYAKEHGDEALRDLLLRENLPELRYKIQSGADLMRSKPLQWVVRGLFPKTGLAGLFGPSGGGKSFLTLDLAATIAGGAPEWFGRRVTHCPVTYCVLEGEAGMGKRVMAWEHHHDKPLPQALRFVTQAVHLTDLEDVVDLAKAIQHAGGADGVVILDTLNRASPGSDENSSKDMGNILAAAKQLQELVGGLILLVHHTGKDPEKGMRGHSSLFAALDGAIGVSKTADGPAWAVAKSKDDATGEVNAFRLEVVVVGIDDFGDEITSCTVEPLAVPLALKKSRRLSPNQQAALDALKAHIDLNGTSNSRVPHSDALAIVAANIDSDTKHKSQRAKEAIDALRKKSLIEADDTHIWPR